MLLSPSVWIVKFDLSDLNERKLNEKFDFDFDERKEREREREREREADRIGGEGNSTSTQSIQLRIVLGSVGSVL